MRRQWRPNGSRKQRRSEIDDEFDGARGISRRPEKNKSKPHKKIKNEKVLLDLLADDPEAEEELKIR